MNDYEEDYDDAYGTAGCQPECLLTKENREDDGTESISSLFSVTGLQVKGWSRVLCRAAFCYGYGKEERYAYIPSCQGCRGISANRAT
jgi:hypothetical protein